LGRQRAALLIVQAGSSTPSLPRLGRRKQQRHLADIADMFAECYGERPDEPYRIVDAASISAEGERIRELLGPEGPDHLLAILPIYYRFMEINAEIFDNSRILKEGMPASPKLTSYLHLCARQPSGRSLYQQMLDDV